MLMLTCAEKLAIIIVRQRDLWRNKLWCSCNDHQGCEFKSYKHFLMNYFENVESFKVVETMRMEVFKTKLNFKNYENRLAVYYEYISIMASDI